jgi:hypothetical protein
VTVGSPYSPTESVTHFLLKLVFAAPANFLADNNIAQACGSSVTARPRLRQRYPVCGDDTNLSLSQDMEVVVGSRCNSSVHFAIGISGLTVGERTYAARYSASFVPSGCGID